MKRPVLALTPLLAALTVTSACAQPAPAPVQKSTIATTSAAVTPAIDSKLRQVLNQAGIKAQILSITSSKLPNMFQISLAGQPPLHMTADGKYVIQGELQKNPSPKRNSQIPPRASSAQLGAPISASGKKVLLDNMSALSNISSKNPFFYTAIPGVIWGASLEGVPFLVSDDGAYITDGEIAVIENGQFTGLDNTFEKRKNQAVFKTLDESQLISYPATTPEKAVVYVATDVNCPYCRKFHEKIPELNKKGVTVKAIGYPIYEESPQQMRAIWSQNSDSARRLALDNAMLKGQMPTAVTSTDFVTPNRDKAAGLAVVATPAIFRADGELYQASFDSPEFLQFLGVR
ncbi:thioredoxin fold domain-containing protein [Psychrobacter ciconiae]|uniref:thioredoxin fold domain-containing protein n=1 Tax=Psychrobacter ciconiae TaxID=1553449 RepID=UPI001919F8D7|nr:thioredoxin fold domain-containing protein [Psychrobacter ciconiae]